MDPTNAYLDLLRHDENNGESIIWTRQTEVNPTVHRRILIESLDSASL